MPSRAPLQRGYVVVISAALLATLVVQVAGASSGAPTAHSASLTAKLTKLTKRVTKLQNRLTNLERQPGPSGPPGEQGEPGVPPACEGNDATDVMVEAGAVCIDRYEASVWSSPTGGTQYGVAGDDYPCSDNGQDCAGVIFARSVAGVTPSGGITYFQAQAALANAGKRLPSNAEWQQAVIGTPDPGASPGSEDCNTNSAAREVTGERANCISDFGANDMVGNVQEIVADWGEQSTDPGGCSALGGLYGGDALCLGNGAAADTAFPGMFVRGGTLLNAAAAGPFAITLTARPFDPLNLTGGFRGAR